MELNRLQSFEKITQNGNKDLLLDYMLNLGNKYPVIGNPFNKNTTHQLLWKNVKVNDLPKDIVNHLNQERYTISRYIELTENVLQQTELVLNLLASKNK